MQADRVVLQRYTDFATACFELCMHSHPSCAAFSSSVILERRSATRAGIGCVGSRYTSTSLAAATTPAATTAAHILDRDWVKSWKIQHHDMHARSLHAQHNHKGHFLDGHTAFTHVLFQQSHTIAPITVDESSVLHERTERANQLATLADHCVLHMQHRRLHYFGGRKIAPVAVDQCIRAWFSRPADR